MTEQKDWFDYWVQFIDYVGPLKFAAGLLLALILTWIYC